MQYDQRRATAADVQANWWVLVTVGLGTFMSALDGSVVNTLLPVLGRALGTSVAGIEWVTTVYLLVISGLLLALLSDLGVAPRILARENLKLWHGVGSAMYALQWLCAGVVLWKVTAPKAPSSRT